MNAIIETSATPEHPVFRFTISVTQTQSGTPVARIGWKDPADPFMDIIVMKDFPVEILIGHGALATAISVRRMPR